MNRSCKLLVIALFFISFNAMAQHEEISDSTLLDMSVEEAMEEEIREVYVIVEDMPQFPGGQEAMYQYIAENISYPPKAVEDSIQGKVYVQVTIDKEGRVQDPKVVRSVDPILDNEAIKVIKNMPQWTPGKQRGTPVNVQFYLPVKFAL